MARVPLARNLVQQQPVTDAKFRAFDSGAGAIGEGIRDFGSGVKEAAKAWDSIEAVHDETDVRQNTLQHMEAARLIDQKVKQAKGVYAEPALAEAQREYAEYNASLLKKARSKRAQTMLGDVLAKRTSLSLGALDDYAFGETEKHIGGSMEAMISESGEEAIAHLGDPAAREANIATGLGELDKWAKWKGVPLDSPIYAAKRRDFLDNVHGSIVENYLAEGDVDNAASYLGDHINDISAGSEVKLKAALKGPLQQREASSDFMRATELPTIGGGESGAPTAPGTPGAPVASGGDVIKALFPKARITSTYRGPDDPLSKANPNSWHTKSHAAVDVAPIPGMSFEQYVQTVQNAGYSVLEAKNEVGAGRSAHATGDHWHLVMGKGGPAGAQQAPRRWDKDDAFQRVDSLADKEGWSFERRERAKDQASRAISRDEQLVSRREKAADRAASDWLLERGDSFTDINQMPASIRAGLSSEDVRGYMGVAKSNAKPTGPEANSNTSTTLELMRVLEPEKFAALPLGKYVGQVTRAELQGLAVEQAKMIKGDPDKSVRSKVATTITTFGVDDGLTGDKEATKKKRVRVQKIMEGELQALTGGKRNPTDDELYKAYTSATRDVTFAVNTSFVGIPTGQSERTRPRYELGADDVPDTVRQRIVSGYQQTYGKAPDDEQVGEIFRNGKGRYW